MYSTTVQLTTELIHIDEKVCEIRRSFNILRLQHPPIGDKILPPFAIIETQKPPVIIPSFKNNLCRYNHKWRYIHQFLTDIVLACNSRICPKISRILITVVWVAIL
jgi:hypothetical protein